MKKIILLSACALLAAGAHAQASKKGPKATKTAAKTEQTAPRKEVKMAEWPQLRAFHEVMSKTFHPAEEGNLEPIRANSDDMLERMKALIGTPFPEAYRTTEMKTLVAQLEDQVIQVHEQVQSNASDKELMAALTSAHDAFHNIVGLCRKSGEAHHAH